MNEKRKFDFKWIIIILLIIALLLVLLIRNQDDNEPVETIIKVPDASEEMISMESDKVRIRMNSQLEVIDGKIKDLEFTNYNEGKLLELTIKFDDEVIFQSSKLRSGEKLQKILIDDEKLKTGTNKGLAEIKYYLEDGTYDGETHLEILIKKLNSNDI